MVLIEDFFITKSNITSKYTFQYCLLNDVLATHIATLFDSIVFKKSKFYCEEVRSRLRSGSACYHSVQNLLSSRLLSKNLKINIYRTIILPVVLYGCET